MLSHVTLCYFGPGTGVALSHFWSAPFTQGEGSNQRKAVMEFRHSALAASAAGVAALRAHTYPQKLSQKIHIYPLPRGLVFKSS